LENSFKVEQGNYGFKVGNDEVTLNFRGGSLKEFAEALNRRGREKIQASVITVQPGTQSLLIESLITGEGSRLQFSGASENLIRDAGIADKANNSVQNLLQDPRTVAAGEKSSIPFTQEASAMSANKGIALRFETSTTVNNETAVPPSPPPGPSIPSGGSVSYGGITIENDRS
jgi:flagellar hook-associated protein 2